MTINGTVLGTMVEPKAFSTTYSLAFVNSHQWILGKKKNGESKPQMWNAVTSELFKQAFTQNISIGHTEVRKFLFNRYDITVDLSLWKHVFWCKFLVSFLCVKTIIFPFWPSQLYKKTSENNTNLTIVMFIITVEVKLQKRS